MWLKKIITLIVILSIGKTCVSQENTKYIHSIGIRSGYGFITTHNSTMLYFTNQHIPKLELTYEKTNNRAKAWENEYQNSNFGLGLSNFAFNNPILGTATAIYPYMNINLLGKNRLQWKFRGAIGMGYISKPFDEKTNYKNSAVGSSLNLYFSFFTELSYQLTPKFSINTAVDFSHFSNSSYRKPNLGINIPSINLGLKYHVGKSQEITQAIKPELKDKKTHLEIGGAYTFHQIYPIGGKTYHAKNLSLSLVKRINYKSSLIASIDYFHNTAIQDELARDTIFVSEGWGSSQIGIGIGHYLHFGKFSMGNHIAYYLKNENIFLRPFYIGFSGNYQLSDRLKGFVCLKTHLAKAEYLLIGFKYQLK